MHGSAGHWTIKIMLYNSKVLWCLAYISWFICRADICGVHCPNFVTVLLGMRWAESKYIQEYKVTTLTLSIAISICRNCTGILFSHFLESGYMLLCYIVILQPTTLLAYCKYVEEESIQLPFLVWVSTSTKYTIEICEQSGCGTFCIEISQNIWVPV